MSKSKKFVTQILYRKNDIEHVIGYIAKHYNEDSATENYHWSVKGKRWSRKWVTHEGAIQELLIRAGYERQDTKRTLPIPETHRRHWK